MSNILEQLYIGAVQSSERLSDTKLYRQENERYGKCLESFYNDLSLELKRRYRRLEEAQSQVLSLEMQESFIQGFHLGAAILYSGRSSHLH